MAFNEAILAEETPNFFELVAEEQLREALRPALLYLTKVMYSPRNDGLTPDSLARLSDSAPPPQVLARSRPDRDLFSALWRSRDEVHLIADSALQWIFLTLNGLSTTHNNSELFKI